jgi:sodium pump decarboxylase gamma subunit
MYILATNWSSAFDVVIFGFVMVFVILILLVLIISGFGKMLAPTVRVPKTPKKANEQNNNFPEENNEIEYIEGHLSADYSAAIAMALHLYYSDVHDEESHIITIKTVERRYSPWSSKIYGLNNLVK